MKSTNLLCCTAAVVALAGCGGFHLGGEAGKVNPAFGAAVIHNARVQNAYGNIEQRLRDLSVAFRAAATDTVTFDFDRATLTAESRRVLDQQAMWLLANENVRMAIVGHTDLVGGEAYNDRLGLRRARTALAYLVSKGVSRDRLDALESRGESEPVVQTEERERRNRRAVTMVAGFDRVYVGPDLDGEYARRVYDIYQAGGATAEVVDAEDTGD
ncbi:MAG: OmpA family protein [Pseudomonadota bacterium]